MKQRYLLLLLTIISLVWTSCNDESDDPDTDIYSRCELSGDGTLEHPIGCNQLGQYVGQTCYVRGYLLALTYGWWYDLTTPQQLLHREDTLCWAVKLGSYCRDNWSVVTTTTENGEPFMVEYKKSNKQFAIDRWKEYTYNRTERLYDAKTFSTDLKQWMPSETIGITIHESVPDYMGHLVTIRARIDSFSDTTFIGRLSLMDTIIFKKN